MTFCNSTDEWQMSLINHQELGSQDSSRVACCKYQARADHNRMENLQAGFHILNTQAAIHNAKFATDHPLFLGDGRSLPYRGRELSRRAE